MYEVRRTSKETATETLTESPFFSLLTHTQFVANMAKPNLDAKKSEKGAGSGANA